MVNPYVRLNRIEFVVTLACTGRCKHCSEGDHPAGGGAIDGGAAARAIAEVCGEFRIESLMTFGGEPLLYPDEVCKIHDAARRQGIPKRQLITNGFFSRDAAAIREVARGLGQSGVNNLLLSVDAFHQETIPLEPVMEFAQAALDAGVPVRAHPAWLVGREDGNPYNVRTAEILREFERMGIAASDGNVIFPSGNALKYLGEYFDLNAPHQSPYAENPKDVRSLCIGPDGGVLGGNLYQTDILEIIKQYTPGDEYAKQPI